MSVTGVILCFVMVCPFLFCCHLCFSTLSSALWKWLSIPLNPLSTIGSMALGIRLHSYASVSQSIIFLSRLKCFNTYRTGLAWNIVQTFMVPLGEGNFNDFGGPLTFPPLPPASQCFVEIASYLLHGLAQNFVQTRDDCTADFGDLLTFPLVPPAGWHFWFNYWMDCHEISYTHCNNFGALLTFLLVPWSGQHF